MSPSQFRNLSEQDKAEMIATENVLSKMRSYENWQAELKRKRKSK